MSHFRLATLVAAAALAACGEKTVGPSGVTPTQPFGRMRFVNGVRGTTAADSLNVVLEDVPFAVNVAYGTSHPRPQGGFFPVYVGSRHLVVRRTADPATTVFDSTFTIAESTDYTVIALGTGTAAGAFTIQENTSASAPSPAAVKIRAVNASPAAGAVDVYVTAPAASLTTLQPTFAALPVRGVSAYTTVPAGSYNVRFTSAGTKTVIATVIPNPPVAGATASATLNAGAVRTAVLLDPATGATGAAFVGASLNDR